MLEIMFCKSFSQGYLSKKRCTGCGRTDLAVWIGYYSGCGGCDVYINRESNYSPIIYFGKTDV